MGVLLPVWVAGLLLVGALAVWLVARRNTLLTARYLQQFHHLPELGTYAEAEQRLFWGRAKAPKAVLLLHGWSSSPADFAELYPLLEEAGIPYLAPQLTGFGRDSLSLLRGVKAQDWLRDAMHAYELLAAVAEEVDLVGHSNGGALATYLAVLLPVFRKPVRPHRLYHVDTVDPTAARNAFAYPALPLASLRALWEVQNRVALRRAHPAEAHLFYGEQDESVDIPALLAELERDAIPIRTHGYPRSGHNLLEDYDREEAAHDMVAVLAGG